MRNRLSGYSAHGAQRPDLGSGHRFKKSVAGMCGALLCISRRRAALAAEMLASARSACKQHLAGMRNRLSGYLAHGAQRPDLGSGHRFKKFVAGMCGALL